jgi:hypothetical protein
MKSPDVPSQLGVTPPENNRSMKVKHFTPLVKMPKMKQFPRDGTERPCPTPAKEPKK